MSSGSYQTVPNTGADAYQGVDPYGFTEQAGNTVFGAPAQSMINKGMGAMNAWTTPANDPNSFTNMFMQDFSQLGKGITQETAPLSKQLQQQQQQSIDTGLAQAGNTMAGLGATRSSAMGEAAGDVVGRAATDASTQLANAQLQLLNSMGGQMLGQKANAYNTMMGLPGQVMGYQTAMGEPMYVAPQVQYVEGWRPGGGLSNLTGAAVDIASLF